MGNNANVTYYYPNIIAGIMLSQSISKQTSLSINGVIPYNQYHTLQSVSWSITHIMLQKLKKDPSKDESVYLAACYLHWSKSRYCRR